MTKPAQEKKVWLAFYADWTAMAVFSSEITCLRYAQEHGMNVAKVPFGVDLRQAVK